MLKQNWKGFQDSSLLCRKTSSCNPFCKLRPKLLHWFWQTCPLPTHWKSVLELDALTARNIFFFSDFQLSVNQIWFRWGSCYTCYLPFSFSSFSMPVVIVNRTGAPLEHKSMCLPWHKCWRATLVLFCIQAWFVIRFKGQITQIAAHL